MVDVVVMHFNSKRKTRKTWIAETNVLFRGWWPALPPESASQTTQKERSLYSYHNTKLKIWRHHHWTSYRIGFVETGAVTKAMPFCSWNSIEHCHLLHILNSWNRTDGVRLWPSTDLLGLMSVLLNSNSTQIGLLSQVTYTAGKYGMKTTQSNNEGHWSGSLIWPSLVDTLYIN